MSRGARKGQSAVEFALLVVVAVVMFLGMTQFGLYLYGLGVVENAGEERRPGGRFPLFPLSTTELVRRSVRILTGTTFLL
jgi:hypothetical protein